MRDWMVAASLCGDCDIRLGAAWARLPGGDCDSLLPVTAWSGLGGDCDIRLAAVARSRPGEDCDSRFGATRALLMGGDLSLIHI